MKASTLLGAIPANVSDNERAIVTAAIAMGICIPALVYAMSRFGAAVYIDMHGKC